MQIKWDLRKGMEELIPRFLHFKKRFIGLKVFFFFFFSFFFRRRCTFTFYKNSKCNFFLKFLGGVGENKMGGRGHPRRPLGWAEAILRWSGKANNLTRDT
jgi:hypothetical protein